jgi:hypothetical protein
VGRHVISWAEKSQSTVLCLFGSTPVGLLHEEFRVACLRALVLARAACPITDESLLSLLKFVVNSTTRTLFAAGLQHLHREVTQQSRHTRALPQRPRTVLQKGISFSKRASCASAAASSSRLVEMYPRIEAVAGISSRATH